MHTLFERFSLALGRALTVGREDLRREDGQGAVEYALVVLGVAAIIAVAIGGFGTQIQAFLTGAGAKLADYIPS
jgi:Flp pilus assembly pilin Flp